MPAAGLAAESGAPILFTTAAQLPAADRARARGPAPVRPSTCSTPPRSAPARWRELRRLGAVTRDRRRRSAEGAPRPTRSRSRASPTGSFGWGVKEPGHGLVFANAGRPLDAPAAALLSATADYGPLLLLESPQPAPPRARRLPGATSSPPTPQRSYRPVRGVYNHGWLIGDEARDLGGHPGRNRLRCWRSARASTSTSEERRPRRSNSGKRERT